MDNESEDILEERATFMEYLHIAEIFERVRNEEAESGKKIWNDTKIMIMKMDRGNSEMRAKMARRRTKHRGIKG